MLDEMLSYKGSAGEKTSSNGGMNDDDVPNNFGAVSKYNSYSSIKITGITSNEKNQAILQRLKDNDESFKMLYIKPSEPSCPEGYAHFSLGSFHSSTYEYTIIDGEDIG